MGLANTGRPIWQWLEWKIAKVETWFLWLGKFAAIHRN
jgi:hypothetical protein